MSEIRTIDQSYHSFYKKQDKYIHVINKLFSTHWKDLIQLLF